MTSNETGIYGYIRFRFSAYTLSILTKQIQDFFLSKENINLYEDELLDKAKEKKKKLYEEIMHYQPKFEFGSSLDYVTAHSFLNFM